MNLTPDTKYLVAEKLSGKELVRLCSTDKEMRRLCSSKKFNKLWKNKLKEDYKVIYEGENAYMEYLQNTYFYNQKYYVVMIGYDLSDPGDSFLFKEEKDAINYIADSIYQDGGEIPFFKIASTLDSDGYIKYAGFIYSISQTKFYSKKIHDHVKEYNEKLKEIVEIINKENEVELKIEDLKFYLSDEDIENFDVLIDILIDEFTISEKAKKIISELYK